MTRTKEAGETWLLVRGIGIFIIFNHGTEEFTEPELIGLTE